MFGMGVYGITNKINKKIYVGKSVNIGERWKAHKARLRNNTHYNRYLQRAWNKYGAEVFSFDVIEEVAREGVLNEKEMYWIKQCNTYIKEEGYNLTLGGEGVCGLEFTEEHRAKLSEINKGNQNAKGYRHTEQAIAVMRKKKEGLRLRAGAKLTAETKEKLREHNVGKKMSDKTKRKMSKARQGSKAYQAKLSEVQVEEIRQMLITGIKGREIAKKYNVNESVISKIKRGKTYKS